MDCALAMFTLTVELALLFDLSFCTLCLVLEKMALWVFVSYMKHVLSGNEL